MFRWDLINELAKEFGYQRYLEIGVEDGHCMSRVKVAHRIGVDPIDTPGARKASTELHVCTSDAFFEAQTAPLELDVALVDGLHHADQAWKDVWNVLKHLRDNGTILLHDCNPPDELTQRVPRAETVWTGDVWRAFSGLRGPEGEGLKAHVINTDWGVGIVRKAAWPRSGLAKPWRELVWTDLEVHRHELLGLLPVRDWKIAL